MSQKDLCILIPVAPRYSWVLPILLECLREFWASHPPIVVAHALPQDTTREGKLCWTRILHRGATEARNGGFSLTYLILEEHLPVAPCHAVHLNETLPDLMQELQASHISLMGWDNRRHPSKSPVLGKEFFRLKHLTGDRDPRYNLHPGLWKLPVLVKCCEQVLEKAGEDASAWQFERISARSDHPSLRGQSQKCYQICASSMAGGSSPLGRKIGSAMERFFYMRMIGLLPLIPSRRLRDSAFKFFNFDRVFSNGPYPMIFAGVLAKGNINPNFVSIVSALSGGVNLVERISLRCPTTDAVPKVKSR